MRDNRVLTVDDIRYTPGKKDNLLMSDDYTDLDISVYYTDDSNALLCYYQSEGYVGAYHADPTPLCTNPYYPSETHNLNWDGRYKYPSYDSILMKKEYMRTASLDDWANPEVPIYRIKTKKRLDYELIINGVSYRKVWLQNQLASDILIPGTAVGTEGAASSWISTGSTYTLRDNYNLIIISCPYGSRVLAAYNIDRHWYNLVSFGSEYGWIPELTLGYSYTDDIEVVQTLATGITELNWSARWYWRNK